MTTMHAGEAIAEFMREHGGTQVDWARRIGCSTKHLSQVMNGRVRLSADYAVLIEAHFDLSANYLMRVQTERDLSQARARLLEAR
jgi:addiction module HigA family antidote